MTVAADWLKHRGLARSLARRYFLPGGDADDLEQEALIALWVAARNYDPDSGVPFEAFAALLIRRRLWTAIKTANRGSHRMISDAYRVLDDTTGAYTFDELVEAREELREITSRMGLLTELEAAAVAISANGFHRPGGILKTHDNALQRAKRKLRSEGGT